MVIRMEDIVNSTLVDDEQVEIYAKDINLKELKQGMRDQSANEANTKKTTQKTTVITVKKTVVSADGAKTDFDTKFELTFQSPQEMKEYLDALGYSVANQPQTPASKPSSGNALGNGLMAVWNRFNTYITNNRKAYAEAEKRTAQRKE